MFMAIIGPNRLRFVADDLLSATKEEEARAEETDVSYCGRSDFLGDTVIDHVELSLFSNWRSAPTKNVWSNLGEVD